MLSGSIGAVGALGAALVDNPFALIATLSIAAFGLSAIAPTIFALVPRVVVAGVAAAAATAMVNSIGSIGGFAGPYLTGFITDLTGTQDVTYLAMAGLLLLAGTIALRIDRATRLTHAGSVEALSAERTQPVKENS